MPIEIGSIVEGKVSGLTTFGAFISLDEGKSGLVHISEVANEYVADIKSFLVVGQTVKVKILSVDDKGRINLSIKKASENGEEKKSFEKKPFEKKSFEKKSFEKKGFARKTDNSSYPTGSSGHDYARDKGSLSHTPQRSQDFQTGENQNFEDLLNKFKKQSDESADFLSTKEGRKAKYAKRSHKY